MREKAIVRTSFIGIVVNIALAGLKALIGLFSNSIAIILDAINNLADAMSSVITIIGAKLGAKNPNRRHPLGYGRIEYLSSMIVSAIVLYAGITSLVESVKKIISPEVATYSLTSIVILLIAMTVKILLGLYTKKQGSKHGSGALIASGTEAMMDAILSLAVVISALIYIKWNISLEAYVGVIIAAIIIKAGVEMLIETLNDILGKRSDKDEVKKIKQVICEDPEVRGAYDLIMYNYGPNKNYASVHVELPDTMTVEEVDRLSRRIQDRVYIKTGVVLTGIGVYSHNTTSARVTEVHDEVKKIVMENEWALQMHGFYLDDENKNIRFDLVISFDAEKMQVVDMIKEQIQKVYPDYRIIIAADIDV